MNNNYNFDFNTNNKVYKNSNVYRYNQNTCLSLLENYFGRKGIFSASCIYLTILYYILYLYSIFSIMLNKASLKFISFFISCFIVNDVTSMIEPISADYLPSASKSNKGLLLRV
ncbi:hypothetical protein EDEG_00267 [Edhazardia aedis USNM 41457]|uniref:Uncharacterized protein n=1 Tax=Edhazardia aedis (strain USNM 41457) TaxID=1003232 RepID=J8ZSF8_EDHAE|nr:hypothetical protein EDEG_00267 [Edhazardia aedis USNM 41457]|eukprot:EJW02573.1 hypothetical protein EDEG_00267 [Edhazardia aedis USNM 41457]